MSRNRTFFSSRLYRSVATSLSPPSLQYSEPSNLFSQDPHVPVLLSYALSPASTTVSSLSWPLNRVSLITVPPLMYRIMCHKGVSSRRHRVL